MTTHPRRCAIMALSSQPELSLRFSSGFEDSMSLGIHYRLKHQPCSKRRQAGHPITSLHVMSPRRRRVRVEIYHRGKQDEHYVPDEANRTLYLVQLVSTQTHPDPILSMEGHIIAVSRCQCVDTMSTAQA